MELNSFVLSLFYMTTVVVAQTTSTASFNQGDQAEINCPLAGSTLPGWFGPPSLTTYTNEGSVGVNPSLDTSLKDRLSLSADAKTLQLLSVEVGDSGVYKCSIAGTGDHSITVTIAAVTSMTTTTTTTTTTPTSTPTTLTTTPTKTPPTTTTTIMTRDITASTMTTPTPKMTSTKAGNKDDQSATLIIVLSVVGGVFILGIIGAILILYFRSKHGPKTSKRESFLGSRSHGTRLRKHLHRIPVERNYNIPADYKVHDPYRVYNQYATSVQYTVPDQYDRVYPSTHSGVQYYNGYNTSQQAVSHVAMNPVFVESKFDNQGYMPKVKKEKYRRDSHYHEHHRDSRNNWNYDYSGNWD